MSEYRYDARIDERAKVFALWLGHEAVRNVQLEGYRHVFIAVGEAVSAKRVVDADQADLLYGVIRGHAKAWGYLDDYEADPKLYLSHYIVAVQEAGTDG